MADHNPTFTLPVWEARDAAMALTFTGRDLTGWGLRGEVTLSGTVYKLPGWVSSGAEGKATLAVPSDVTHAFQRQIERGNLIGIRPDGTTVILGDLLVNGLEQP